MNLIKKPKSFDKRILFLQSIGICMVIFGHMRISQYLMIELTEGAYNLCKFSELL